MGVMMLVPLKRLNIAQFYLDTINISKSTPKKSKNKVQKRSSRKKSNLTQAQLAKMLKSSQSRVAKMEKGDPSVSVDLVIKSLLAMGANKESIAKAIT